MKYAAYAKVSGSKFLGIFEADSEAEAEKKAWESDGTYVSLCHHCSDECEDPEVESITLEERR